MALHPEAQGRLLWGCSLIWSAQVTGGMRQVHAPLCAGADWNAQCSMCQHCNAEMQGPWIPADMLRQASADRGACERECVCAQVRVDAVAALRNLVDAFHKDDLPSIKPLIPNLLNQLFALMNEVCSRPVRILWLASRCLHSQYAGPARSASSSALHASRCPRLWLIRVRHHGDKPFPCRRNGTHAAMSEFEDRRQKASLQCKHTGCRWRARMWCSLWRLLWRTLGARWRPSLWASASTSPRRSGGYRQARSLPPIGPAHTHQRMPLHWIGLAPGSSAL